MTTIKVSKKNGKYSEIKVSGHTNYAEEGKDIVCASISTLVQSTMLGLKTYVNKNIKFVIDEQKPLYKIIIPDFLTESQYSKAELLLDTLVISLTDLAEGFPKNLKMEVKNDVY